MTPKHLSPRRATLATRENKRNSIARAGMLAGLLAVSASVAACEGCKGAGTSSGAVTPTRDVTTPTARIYLVSDLAGALEPCGCVKDQLGGLDHAGAWIASEHAKAPHAVAVSAGPIFFMDPKLEADKAGQDTQKAETIAGMMKTMGLVAFAPGKNEWAAGAPELAKLETESGAVALASNVDGVDGLTPKDALIPVNGLNIGFIGVAALDSDVGGAPLPNAKSRSAADEVKARVASLKQRGANAVIALAATGRGDAKRIADAAPDLLCVLVGSPGGVGEANTQGAPIERVGDVLIVETANHMQSLAVLDLFVETGSYKFADGTGLALQQKRDDLTHRIDELRVRIAVWEKDPSIKPADIEARRADAKKLEGERATLATSPPPPNGSFFRYEMEEIRTDLGTTPDLTARMLAYYKQVNDANAVAFKDKLPPAPEKGKPTYVGVDVCENCHDDAYAVWKKTPHFTAYKTLQDAFKEYNLDCVGCHVTGYEKPGGSNVTHVASLKDVQCEVCHGPGSAHAKSNDKIKVPVPKPTGDVCLGCHHPPHVHEFDPKVKMEQILGPGHGKPKS